jgi:hypothetical protein
MVTSPTPKKHPLLFIISLIFSCLAAFSLFSGLAQSQDDLNLPQPGTMVTLSPQFAPSVLKGIQIYPDNPLKFDFIVDKGDSDLNGEALKAESQKLVKYFLAALTIPEEDLWVNLSPFEQDKIIPDGTSQTEMGKGLLE